MYTVGKVLRTDADFDNAILFALNVEVWKDGKLIDEGGLIKMFNDTRVHIRHGLYPRSVCVFIVR